MPRIYFKKILFALLIILAGFSLQTKTTHAFWGIGDIVEEVGPNLTTNLETTVEATLIEVKDYVLDGLAYDVAKILLQQLTADVVNWINSGFEGSPAFVTNPEGFFADSADQVTGAFIANSGPLSALCSPFSLDIRLALSLNFSGRTRQRYVCTLGSILNGYGIGGSNVSASMSAFIGGDFSQGGWPGFIALSTDPQNNPYGAYLSAESDLHMQIADRQSSINADLNRGGGILSYKKCEDTIVDANHSVNAASLGLSQQDFTELQNTGKVAGRGQSSYATKVDPNTGYTTYQTCTVQTPGSAISSMLNKSLNAPTDELLLADSLNEIVDALFMQLTTRVLSDGLYAASKPNTSGRSLTSQLSGPAATARRLATARKNLANQAQKYLKTAKKVVPLREKAVEVVKDVKDIFESARACYTVKFNFAQADRIAGIITSKVDPILAEYQAKLDDASEFLATIQGISDGSRDSDTAEELQAVSERLVTIIQNTTVIDPNGDEQPATDDLKTAREQAADLKKQAQQELQTCNQTPHL